MLPRMLPRIVTGAKEYAFITHKSLFYNEIMVSPAGFEPATY